MSGQEEGAGIENSKGSRSKDDSAEMDPAPGSQEALQSASENSGDSKKRPRDAGDDADEAPLTAEQLSKMSRSERKRHREKKRRSDVNRGFDELMTLLLEIDPEVRAEAAERARRGHWKGIAGAQEENLLSRVDLIGQTIKVLKRLHQENEQRKRIIEDLRRGTDPAAGQRAGINEGVAALLPGIGATAELRRDRSVADHQTALYQQQLLGHIPVASTHAATGGRVLSQSPYLSFGESLGLSPEAALLGLNRPSLGRGTLGQLSGLPSVPTALSDNLIGVSNAAYLQQLRNSALSRSDNQNAALAAAAAELIGRRQNNPNLRRRPEGKGEDEPDDNRRL